MNDFSKETRDILSKIRMMSERETLNEEVFDKSKADTTGEFPITKNTPQFGDIRTSQEETLLKTIGERVDLDEKALVFYPSNNDIVFNGKVPSLNFAFQFKYNDPSGEGCYVWSNGMQLTDSNYRTIGKIRDAFLNWKQYFIDNGDLLDKLKKAAEKN